MGVERAHVVWWYLCFQPPQDEWVQYGLHALGQLFSIGIRIEFLEPHFARVAKHIGHQEVQKRPQLDDVVLWNDHYNGEISVTPEEGIQSAAIGTWSGAASTS